MTDQPATGASQAPLGTEGNPTHVVSRPAPIIGWVGVQSGVEEFDREEIQGYKEDMDALLVFIGLFSAVLAGFVAMSFSLLKADPADSMVYIMMGMSIQAASYTITGSFINSTTPAPTSLPQFEPSHNAIVVNILWTASLIVSLATASFAICVKQWLRGYTASTTSFALSKMRIRSFRRLALEDWDVLEIASALPLLLQISLALFFIGLCYFTADIHPSVKNTTLPLVSAWAFFFIAATILPVFSARCPYKTPALSSLTSAMRVYLRPFWIKVLQILVATCADRDERSSFLRSILTTVRVGIATALANITYEGCLRVLGHVRLLWTKTSRILSITGAHVREWLHHIGAIRTMVHGWAYRTLISMTEEKHPHDEATAIKTNAGDLAILVNADKLHGNDEVADAAISHAVRQSNLDWKEVLELAKSLILHRLPSQDVLLGGPKLVELGDLTPRALVAVHNVLYHVESSYSRIQRYPWEDVTFLGSVSAGEQPERWTFFLRLSVLLKQPPTTLPRWLDRCTEDDCAMLSRICQPTQSAQVVRSLLALLCRRLERPAFNLSTSVSRLQSFLGVYFGELHIPDSFGADQSRPWSTVLNRESLGPTVAWLTQRLKSDIATPAAGSSDVHSSETVWGDAISLIVKLMAVAEDTSVFGEIPPVAVKSSEMLRTFWISCFNYQLQTRPLVPLGGLDAQGLSNIKTAIAALASDPPSDIDGEKAMWLCWNLCLSLWDDHGDIRASNLVPAWRDVFDALTQLVQRTQVEDSDDARNLVDLCFYYIEDIDGIDNSHDDVEYAAWLATFNPEDSPVPDEFISALLRINPDTRYGGRRVHRLKEISAEDKRPAGGEVVPQSIDGPLATSGGDNEDTQLYSDDSKQAADNDNAEINATAGSPGETDGLPTEAQPTLRIHRGVAELGHTPVSTTELPKAAHDDRGDHSTLEPAPASESLETQDSSANLVNPVDSPPPISTMRDSEEASAVNDFPRDKDSNDYELTGRDDVLRTQPDTVDDRHSEAIIDEASPAADATSSPPARDEKQEPSPPDPDTIRDGSPPLLPDIDVTDSSSQDANLDHSNGGHSSAAATSGVVPEAADPLAEPAADNAQTGLSGAVASTHERSSYRSQNDIGLSPASAPPESVSEGFPDIHPSVVTDGQQTRDSTSASGIFSARGVGDVEATRNDGQTFDAAHSEHGRGAVRDDDRLQFLDGGDDVVPREGVEDEEDT